MTSLPPPGSRVVVRDVAVLKALAHPMRTRLLGLLRVDGPSTATLLGRRVGESSGVTSYHLRELERYGFVAEEVGRGTGRERWWRAVHRSTSWDRSDFAADGDDVAAALQSQMLDLRARTYDASEQQRAARSAEWQQTGSLSDLVLRLTPDQAASLVAELDDVLRRWSEASSAPGAPGTGLVAVFADVLPLTELPTGTGPPQEAPS